MILFATAIILTLGISFLCSLMEALILSTTVSEVESLKKTRPRRGVILEQLKTSLEETISTILTLNTIHIHIIFDIKSNSVSSPRA